MRVMITCTPESTHLVKMVPVAWALRSAGHEVVAVVQPDLVDTALTFGISVQVVGPYFCLEEQITSLIPDGRRPIEARVFRDFGGSWDHVNKTWIDNTRTIVDGVLAFAGRWRPDLVMCDTLEYAGRIAAAAQDRPVVTHRWGVDVMSADADQLAARALRSVMERAGVAVLPSPRLVLDPCAPSVQVPDAATALPIRYIALNGRSTLPAWLTDDVVRPRVCWSFGRLTAALNGRPLFRALLDAWDGVEGEAVFTLPAEFHQELGPVPENVRVVEPLPLEYLLGSCDAVVHHGGGGTMLSSCRFGLPQLVLPGYADQLVVGQRIEARGLGLTVERPADQIDVDVLTKSMVELLDSESFRVEAGAVRDEMASAPTPHETVGILEEMVGDAAPA